MVGDALLAPEAAHERQRLVEPGRALLAGDAERLLLGGLHHAEPEGRQRASAGQEVERGPLLREQEGVAAGQDLHRRAELHALRAARGERQRHHRVWDRPGRALGAPDRVEAQPLQRVDRDLERSVMRDHFVGRFARQRRFVDLEVDAFDQA